MQQAIPCVADSHSNANARMYVAGSPVPPVVRCVRYTLCLRIQVEQLSVGYDLKSNFWIVIFISTHFIISDFDLKSIIA